MQPRPTKTEILTALADRYAPKFDALCGVTPEEAHRYNTKDDLLKAMSGGDGSTAYTVTRVLETHCNWDCDDDIYDLVDEMLGHKYTIEVELLSQWVKDNNLTLQREIGMNVSFPHNGKTYTGQIARLHPETYQYTVSIPELGHMSWNSPRGTMGVMGLIVPAELVMTPGVSATPE